VKERKDIYWRAYLIYFGFVALMLLVLFQTLSLQWQDVAKDLDLTEENEGKIPTRLRERIPRRGEILDANRTPLVTSVPFYDIHMDPQVVEEKIFLEEISNLSRELAKMYPSMSAGDYERYIRRARKNGKRYLLIKKRVTNEERRKLREFPIYNLGRLKGGLIDTDETIIRKRPQGELLKRTLGFVQKNADGTFLRVGIEGAYNDYLTGEKGEEIEQKISTGWKRTGQIVKDAVEGADVITTIDKEIHEFPYRLL
jgi:cell division protein FtsI (penicillin-binding protein 3)